MYPGDGQWHVLASLVNYRAVNIIYVAGPFLAMGIKLQVNGPTCCGGLNTYAVIREFEAYADNNEPVTYPYISVENP